MTSITLPFWVFALSLGVPCLLFLCLVGFLLRKIRNPKKNEMANHWLQHMGNTKFHNDLLYSQIDTIFNGMNAIIESERLKVQALLTSGNPNAIDTRAVSDDVDSAMETVVPPNMKEDAVMVERQFTKPIDDAGSAQEDGLQVAGLSQSEIELAMRMRACPEAGSVRKLEAVA